MLKKIVVIALTLISTNAMAQAPASAAVPSGKAITAPIITSAPLSQLSLNGTNAVGFIAPIPASNRYIFIATLDTDSLGAQQITADQAKAAQPFTGKKVLFNGKPAPGSLTLKRGSFSTTVANIPAGMPCYSFSINGTDYLYAFDSNALAIAPPSGLDLFVPYGTKP